MTEAAAEIACEPAVGPWNPGVRSDLPPAFLPLVTVYRPEHVETPLRDALETSDLCGLPARQLTRFRAGRLVVHEVLIRVMSDLSVPVGAVYADLGVNFRAIVATILREGIEPRLGEVEAVLTQIRAEADAVLDREIAAIFDDPPATPPPAPNWLDRLFGRRPPRHRPLARISRPGRCATSNPGIAGRRNPATAWKPPPAKPCAAWYRA
ncbi:hypothetical protein ACRAWG_14550 [Methylobacterium sp. P31]